MDLEKRVQKVEALNQIKERALNMADKGADPLAVRSFIGDSTKELAFALPDYQAYEKAAKASKLFKSKLWINLKI